ncbi:minor tail protein [Arthrobacter phage Pureglobe5]|nr:minor tail protein [Arthrobacter phage Pureglobe5]
MPRVTNIQQRGGTAAQWAAANPVLAEREIGLEADTLKLKWGDGTTAWNSLPYFTSRPASDESRGYLNSGKSINGLVVKQGTAPTVVTSATAMGGKAIAKNGSLHGWWEDMNGLTEFDPQTLYRFTVRVRVATAQTNGAGKGFYFGPVGFADKGVTYINASGANSYSSQQWTTQNSQTDPSGVWVDYVTYVKGWNATPGVGGSGTLTSPRTMYPGTMYFAPGFIVDYNNGNGIWEISHWSVDAIGSEAQAAQNTANSHSAANITSGTINDARLPSRLNTIAATITDWNTTINNGWHMGYNAANAPVANQWFIGRVLAHNSLYVTQTVHQFTADSETDTKTWRRSSTDVAGVRTWGAWYRVFQSATEIQTLIGTHTHPDATGTVAGFMPAADKAKLDGAASGLVNSALVIRDSAGNFSAATPSAAAHVATKGYVDALPAATSSAAGLMPAADKALLDNRATGLVVSTLVARDSTGVFSAGTPTADAHVATKGYVDAGRMTASPGTQFRYIGCVIRFNATSGQFEFINDAGHFPSGVSSVVTYSDRIVVNYSFTGTKVITANVTPDEKLAQQGFTMGPSVGTSSMTIYLGQGGFTDYVTATGSTFTSMNGFVTAMSRSTTTWTFTHDYVDGPIGGQASYRGGAYQAIAEGMGNTTTNVSLWSATTAAQVNPSIQGSGTSYSFWIMRGGTRRVNPLTDLNIQNSNIWISALMEI